MGFVVILIEFAGLPGSGKTTLKAELEAALGQSGVRITRRVRPPSGRIQGKLGSLFHNRRAVLAAARALLRDSRPIAHRVRALRWLLATLEFIHQASELVVPNSVMVLGEGISQRALLVFFDGRSSLVSSHLAAYISAAPKPDVIVRLDLDPAVAVKRQRARRVADLDRGVRRAADRFDLQEDRLSLAMQGADVFLGQVISTLAAQWGVDVIRLDTTDLDAAAADVRTRVVDLVLSHIS